ncbi:unnamed protein product [Dovyalis caffra]|uniref:Uncharacterized protein n=1 Tax=Dovyalis caffra TaxID=77055 RepID=A0AAV1R6Y0_9ROSI|nr:unnamed protein product [Dovyalis caffra]
MVAEITPKVAVRTILQLDALMPIELDLPTMIDPSSIDPQPIEILEYNENVIGLLYLDSLIGESSLMGESISSDLLLGLVPFTS